MNMLSKPLPGLAGRTRRRTHCGRAQRGVVMVVTLMALAVMLIGAVALVRSFNTSLFTAGNLAFKRDLVNQAERAAAEVLTRFENDLDTIAVRGQHQLGQNYRAAAFARFPIGVTSCADGTASQAAERISEQGIPCALLRDDAFSVVGLTANDVVHVNGDTSTPLPGVRIRYLIDRLCNNIGSEVTLTSANCTVGPTPDARGGSASDLNVATLQPQVLYRLSVRVDGPRNTQAFFQTTLAL